MAVSRQTFQLIIDSARKKVALALTEGKSIHISGGNYTYNICEYKCEVCDHVYTTNYEGKSVCPACGASGLGVQRMSLFAKGMLSTKTPIIISDFLADFFK